MGFPFISCRSRENELGLQKRKKKKNTSHPPRATIKIMVGPIQPTLKAQQPPVKAYCPSYSIVGLAAPLLIDIIVDMESNRSEKPVQSRVVMCCSFPFALHSHHQSALSLLLPACTPTLPKCDRQPCCSWQRNWRGAAQEDRILQSYRMKVSVNGYWWQDWPVGRTGHFSFNVQSDRFFRAAFLVSGKPC